MASTSIPTGKELRTSVLLIQIAAAAVRKLKAQEPALKMNGEKLIFDTSSGQVQLFIGNLTPEWTNDSEFYSGMEQYGSVERAFVMRNIEGASKVSLRGLLSTCSCGCPGSSTNFGCSHDRETLQARQHVVCSLHMWGWL